MNNTTAKENNMTFYNIQKINDLKLLKRLKQEFTLKAERYKGDAYHDNKNALKYCNICDVVDRLHWRIKEITDDT